MPVIFNTQGLNIILGGAASTLAAPYIATGISLLADKAAIKADSLEHRFDPHTWKHTALKISKWSLVSISALSVALGGTVAILTCAGGAFLMVGLPASPLVGLFILINGIGGFYATKYAFNKLTHTLEELKLWGPDPSLS